MEIGSWAIIQEPSLLALIPLIIFIVLAFREVNNTVAAIAGCAVGAVLLGLNLKGLAAGIQAALGSSTVMMGVIVMMGAALGALMNEARITHRHFQERTGCYHCIPDYFYRTSRLWCHFQAGYQLCSGCIKTIYIPLFFSLHPGGSVVPAGRPIRHPILYD